MGTEKPAYEEESYDNHIIDADLGYKRIARQKVIDTQGELLVPKFVSREELCAPKRETGIEKKVE